MRRIELQLAKATMVSLRPEQISRGGVPINAALQKQLQNARLLAPAATGSV